MTLADAYRRLGVVLSGLESQGIEVAAVTPNEAAGEEPLVVDLRITVPSDADAPEVRFGDSAPPGSVGADGGTRATSTAEATPSPDGATPESGSGPASAVDGAEETDEGAYPCGESGCPAGFDSEAALTVHRLSQHDRPEEPLHQHEPALRAAYEGYDSFSSMTGALGVDVTAQTVRRNMMKAGIHTPDTDDGGEGGDTHQGANADGGPPDEDGTGTDDDTAAEVTGTEGDGPSGRVESSGESVADDQPITDGSGTATAGSGTAPPGDSAGGSPGPRTTPSDPAAERLPGDVTVEALRDAVVVGGSLRAVARRLDRSSGEARSLLDELGLLEQVHGRVATRPDRDQRAAAFDDWVEACRSDGPSGESGRTDS